MIQDDRTKYDIGEPFMTVRFNGGTCSHTPKGVVISVDSGIRYTCSYSRLISYLKGSCKNYDEFIEETNVNDIMAEFKNECKRLIKEAEKRNNELNKI